MEKFYTYDNIGKKIFNKMVQLLDEFAMNRHTRDQFHAEIKTIYFFPRIKSSKVERIALSNMLYMLQNFCELEFCICIELPYQRYSEIYEFPYIRDIFYFFFEKVLQGLKYRNKLES
jgi:hypothetical protein